MLIVIFNFVKNIFTEIIYIEIRRKSPGLELVAGVLVALSFLGVLLVGLLSVSLGILL